MKKYQIERGTELIKCTFVCFLMLNIPSLVFGKRLASPLVVGCQKKIKCNVRCDCNAVLMHTRKELFCFEFVTRYFGR